MKSMQCPCGEQLQGETDDEFVDAVEKHLQDKHPEMAGHYSREQILSRAT